MQINQPRAMATTERVKFGFILYNLDENIIGNKGCEFLSKSDWPFMKKLDFCRNQIGSEGVVHLRKANWPLLESIKLSIIIMFKIAIR